VGIRAEAGAKSLPVAAWVAVSAPAPPGVQAGAANRRTRTSNLRCMPVETLLDLSESYTLA